MSNLAKTWYEICKDVDPEFGSARAVALIYEVTGNKYTQSRFGEWVNGKKPVPKSVRPLMVRDVLVRIYERAGAKISSRALDEMTEILA